MALNNVTNATLPRDRGPLASDTSTTTTNMKPLNFLVALYPGFQLMDLAGPLDIFNIVTLPPFSQPLRLTFLASDLSPVPTKPIPPPGANYTYDLNSVLGVQNVNTTFNQFLIPEYTYASYLSRLSAGSIPDAEQPDILFIPGGLGSRMNRISPAPSSDSEKNTTSTLNAQDLIDWIPTITPHLRTGIMTVCTGSDILARTGLLNERRATTNMLRFKEVAQRHSAVKWVRGARWVKSGVDDGISSASKESKAKHLEIWSSAGISAGMDVTLAFIAEYFGGMDVSRDIARRLEYDWAEDGEGEVGGLYKRFFDDM